MNQIINDQQLVAYILRQLNEQEYSLINQQIETDEMLQKRLNQWEEVLFKLNQQTPEIKPPKVIWNNIENRLFPENSIAKNKQKKYGFGNYLIPAFFSLAILFTGSYYFSQQPSYHAQVIATKNNQAIWEIEGNDQQITFTSLSNVSMANMDCQAWIIKGDKTPIRLGKIPDTGHQLSKNVSLPNNLSVAAGDKVIILMTKKDYAEKLPPAGVPIMNSVVLAAI